MEKIPTVFDSFKQRSLTWFLQVNCRIPSNNSRPWIKRLPLFQILRTSLLYFIPDSTTAWSSWFRISSRSSRFLLEQSTSNKTTGSLQLRWLVFSGHSFRRGTASFALHCGVPSDYIKLQGNWKLTAYKRYLDHSLRCNLEAVKQMSKGITH